ncbi:hypothetical protein EDD29_7612 [Actinocorallia herbida]|uniref:Uncharacterized protein n=1 Tax=Actinocorallia herbida TaxID=58109 RepID=A0A3N1D8P0_9ACTN|nr:DUF6114 domain-containing protein [Actinocorallia herbida]ROO89902.1 hypothetical protein EDD29_7612 [Actinocorallia herbida]
MSASSAPLPRTLAGFRQWRRTRPFWGGVFAVLAGLELISIPFAPLALSIHQGMPGVASWLAGALLITGGVLAWVHPVQRHFYGIIAMLAALASFPTSNLGGFLLGLLLGVVGAGMIFAWAPGRDGAVDGGAERARDEIAPGLVS